MTNLCNQAVTAPVTAQIATPAGQTVGTPVAGFGNPQALTIQARFTCVTGTGTSISAWVQTTIDGTNWVDIACFGFTTSSAAVFVNVNGTANVSTPTAIGDGVLAANTILPGVLGSQYRVKITSAGTYASGTTVAIDVQQH